ncbi:hypothetical protein AOL_s00188g179 [Orbilia oligospora ATCC 24927]|uniref:Uncharacterized protein n=1 Tax=Arthrobotrys oligospora (strain ATCC 24927 / CBS 115.81 / DSM 1491) TaxID=756982 RepID=G1XQG7_ARTOA|nr:hypothetical protein AOL_s00188g179 [Orbilia oligospora ATCC 24927]EGX44511.1 hypothetical protein AOL_s00188g179 [Orbilia oligospora ATCC 24927]
MQATRDQITVGVVIPAVSSKLMQIPDVREVKDVLNRISGMMGLKYNLMTAYCGGKFYREWYHLAEGDVIWIEYPEDKLPDKLKEIAAKEAASRAEKLFIPRKKAALPIIAPTNGTRIPSVYEGNLGYSGSFVQRPAPAPVLPLPLKKAATVDYLAGDLFHQPTNTFVPKGVKYWENNSGNPQGFGNPASLEQYGTTGNYQRYPSRPPPTASITNPQARWSIAGIDSSVMLRDHSMFTKNYRKGKINPMIRINFKFWTGQDVPLQLHPENRISTIVKSLIAMMKTGKEGVTPDLLVFKGPNPGQKITLEDKMITLFPEHPAEIDIEVSLAGAEQEDTDTKMDYGGDYWKAFVKEQLFS